MKIISDDIDWRAAVGSGEITVETSQSGSPMTFVSGETFEGTHTNGAAGMFARKYRLSCLVNTEAIVLASCVSG